jgi:uncharacterized protein (TIGR02246 family)
MTSHPSSDPSAEHALRELLDAWCQAAGRLDLDALMACYTPDVVAYDAIQTLRFEGADAYRAHWQACLQYCPSGLRFSVRDADIQADGDVAYIHALIECQGSGQDAGCWSRMTMGLRRTEGRWRIAHEHFSFPADVQTGKAMMHLRPEGVAAPVLPVPPDMNTVTPHLVCADAISAIGFYERAFGARVTARLDGPQGQLLHASLSLGDSHLMLMEESEQCGSRSPATLKGTPVILHVYVRDVDAAFKQAVEAGCQPLMEPQDMFWGDRYGVVRDPYGHQWSLATHVRDMAPDDIRQAFAAMASAEKA